jgi:hypothetical protein
MPSSPMKKTIPAGMLQRFLSSPPSLTNDEDRHIYNELYAEVYELVQPEDICDQMMVSDVTNHFWVQMRFRRSEAFIINANQRRALEELLEGLGLKRGSVWRLADAFFGYERRDLNPDDILDMPFSGSQVAKTRNDVVELLAKYNLDESCIDQLAVKASLEDLKRLDDLALRHELRREQILREVERRREQRSARRVPGGHALPAAEVRALPKKQRRKATQSSEKS